MPQRVTDRLISVLRRYHPLFLSLHFTHPVELTPDCRRACEKLAEAARKAGRQLFLGSYPITPATEILMELARHKSLGAKVFQAEDEIAAIGSALGAAGRIPAERDSLYRVLKVHEQPLPAVTVTLLVPPDALAIKDPDNQGRWESKPTGNNAPDKDVPGFLVNLGPTGARARLTSTTFVVRYLFKDSPAASRLKVDDVRGQVKAVI